MSGKDDKKLNDLTERLIELKSKIYEAQKDLNELEEESSSLLRDILHRKRNG